MNIKIEKNKRGNIIFKLNVAQEYEKIAFVKRIILDSKYIKNDKIYKYRVPVKYLIPIVNNYKYSEIKFDENSLNTYLEFSDCFDDKYYYETEFTPKYMKKWRKEGCPNIYKITIDKKMKTIKKDLVFRKRSISIK